MHTVASRLVVADSVTSRQTLHRPLMVNDDASLHTPKSPTPQTLDYNLRYLRLVVLAPRADSETAPVQLRYSPTKCPRRIDREVVTFEIIGSERS